MRGAPTFVAWTRIATRLLPFADAASADVPLRRLLRLSLFQVSVGMAAVLLNGTLNRVMIVELAIPAWLVAAMIALPLLFAPLRALVGHRSDHHRSILGWRRVPYIWFGTLLQFGGLAVMPFALLIVSRDGVTGLGLFGCVVAFLFAGVGIHTTQTAGLALATDLAPETARPRVVALLYVALLGGMMLSALLFAGILVDFSPTRLVQVVQGAAVATVALNVIALWKQEARGQARPASVARPAFRATWREVIGDRPAARLLLAVGLGAAAFSMQDALLEPYGGEMLGLSVGGTTALTGLWALGSLAGFALAGRWLADGWDAQRVAGTGGVAGVAAFLPVLFAAPLGSAPLLQAGALGIGFGAGLFLVGTLTAAMALARGGASGIALGAWGAVQATAAGTAIALGGVARDLISAAAVRGDLGATLAGPGTGYAAVYLVEIALLVFMLVVLGPLVRDGEAQDAPSPARFGLSQFPS
jgi:BCD family chlorophyll transporter-like MFS transporter